VLIVVNVKVPELTLEAPPVPPVPAAAPVPAEPTLYEIV
jgi:hypothetical protein